MPNSVLKSIKIPLKLHREVKAESVQTDENIEAVIERAWRVYRSAATQKGYQSLIKKRDAPLPETGDKTLPAKEFEKVSEDRSYAGLQSRQLREAILALQSSGRIAELHVLTAFATFLVSYEPSEATPDARSGEGDPDLIESSRRVEEAQRLAARHGIRPPDPAGDAPDLRPSKSGPKKRAG